MTPSRDPDADTQRAAAASSGAPATEPESDRDRALAALFGASAETALTPTERSAAEETARHDQLAALFGGSPVPGAADTGAGASAPGGADTDGQVAAGAPGGADAASPATAAAGAPVASRSMDAGTADATDAALAALLSSRAVQPPVADTVAAGTDAADAAPVQTPAEDAAQAAEIAPARGIRRGRRRRTTVDGAEGTPAAIPQPPPVEESLPDAATAPEERQGVPGWLAAAAPVGAAAARNDESAPADAGADVDNDDDPLAWLGFADEPASADDTAGTEDEPARVAADADAPAAPMPAVDWASLVNGTAATSVLPTVADDATELLGTPGPRRTADDDATRVLGATAVGATAGAVGASSASALGGVSTPAPVTATVDPAAGSFSPTEKRGVRAWSRRVRWSVAISIVLLAGVVAGSILIAQTVAANSREAQELSAAVADLEAAEAAATEPEFALQEAIGIYDDTVELAQTTADSAGPPLAAVAGMTDETLLTASNTALADLVAQLAVDTAFETPAAYERGDVDLTDLGAIAAATEAAEAHATAVTAATDEVRLAQAALQQKLDALRAAQVALGASLPATAEVIAAENPRAEQSFRDAVIAAAAAVPAAQNAGGSGDAELTAYAAAVTALRGDQVRAEEVVEPVRPANPAPQPTPTTDPAPAPDPVPQPTPTETAPVPLPTDPPVTP